MIVEPQDLAWLEQRRTVSYLAGNKVRAAMLDRIYRQCGGKEPMIAPKPIEYDPINDVRSLFE